MPWPADGARIYLMLGVRACLGLARSKNRTKQNTHMQHMYTSSFALKCRRRGHKESYPTAPAPEVLALLSSHWLLGSWHRAK